MAKRKLVPVGTDEEISLFEEVKHHYDLAKEDLEQRIPDFDKKDELFRSYIDENNWPYNSVVFDPRVFTAIFEKTSRLFANKPKGRLIPREGGDTLGARINNELLNFQWDDNERVDSMAMLAKWATMDMNARKYGAAFGINKWHFERKKSKDKSKVWYDGPNFRPLLNRDCLPNPAYSTIKHWFQHRDYVTVSELESINDAARTEPKYKNLDLLLDQIEKSKKGGGDRRDTHWTSRNKEIKGLQDYLGRDKSPLFQTIEIVNEYRDDRWITFAPKYGVVIRDIPNPYEHGQIPVVLLRYYPIDDDIYGLSEIEPIERLQRATNALINQYMDAINMGLYKILKVRAVGVQMHTLKWGPGEKWIMNDPSSDVIEHESSTTGIAEFTSTYSFMIAAMQNALGESSLGVSNVGDFQKDKTATEVFDVAMQRNARDNFNSIFLSEAMKKQMMHWLQMNKQFLFSTDKEKAKVVRIIGKDSIRFFEKMGLDKEGIDDETAELLASPELSGLDLSGTDLNPDNYSSPIFPAKGPDGMVTKFTKDLSGESGNLIIEPEDVAGTYDYIPDVESMQLPNSAQMLEAKKELVSIAQNPDMIAILGNEGYKLKSKELLEDYFEQIGIKDADKYFEKIEGGVNGQLNTAGAVAAGGMPQGQGAMPIPGMAGGSQAVSPEQVQQQLAGPTGI